MCRELLSVPLFTSLRPLEHTSSIPEWLEVPSGMLTGGLVRRAMCVPCRYFEGRLDWGLSFDGKMDFEDDGPCDPASCFLNVHVLAAQTLKVASNKSGEQMFEANIV